MASIEIPKILNELFELSFAIIRQHEKEGSGSILRDLDMKGMEEKLTEARAKYLEAIELKSKSEELMAEVRKLMGVQQQQNSTAPGTVRYQVMQVRDILKGVNRDSMNRLCDWGFVVSGNNGSGKQKNNNP